MKNHVWVSKAMSIIIIVIFAESLDDVYPLHSNSAGISPQTILGNHSNHPIDVRLESDVSSLEDVHQSSSWREKRRTKHKRKSRHRHRHARRRKFKEFRSPNEDEAEREAKNSREVQKKSSSELYSGWSRWTRCNKRCVQKRRKKCRKSSVCDNAIIRVRLAI